MPEFISYIKYEAVPPTLRKQWARMHIQEFPHVPAARAAWRAGAQALLCLALDESRVLAWSMYYWKPGTDRPELYTYTRRSARGQGHGKAVAVAAREAANQLWPNRKRATFYPHNARAQALYASLGYWDRKADKSQSNA